MSRVNDNFNSERRELLNKAESYYEEWEEATLKLEEDVEKIGKNLLVVASIGVGLAFTYKLLSGADDEQNPQNISKDTYKKPSRFGSAMKAIAVPFLLGIAKNVVFPDLNKNKKDNNGGNP